MATLQLLTKQAHSGLLHLDHAIVNGSSTLGKIVREILEEKHPDARLAHADALLNEELANDDFLFGSITAEAI